MITLSITRTFFEFTGELRSNFRNKRSPLSNQKDFVILRNTRKKVRERGIFFGSLIIILGLSFNFKKASWSLQKLLCALKHFLRPSQHTLHQMYYLWMSSILNIHIVLHSFSTLAIVSTGQQNHRLKMSALKRNLIR